MNSPAVLNQPIVISQYEALTNNIIIAEQKSAGAVFNYRDPKENKLARSHVYGLRTLKGSIESARKEAKSYALDYGRRVDSAAKESSDRVDALIFPHETEIKAIEAEENARKDKHQEVIDRIQMAREWTTLHDSKLISQALDMIKSLNTDEMEEFKAQADAEIIATIKHLDDVLAGSLLREKEAAELARLRKEAAEREEKDRIERIQREAIEAQRRLDLEAKIRAEQEAKAEQARKDKAAKDKIERAKLAEQQAKIDAERAELRAKEAEARAAYMAKREQEAIERHNRELAEIEARRVAREKREQENRAEMVRQIACAIDTIGTNPMTIAEAIVSGAIAHVRVDWEA
jgi:hypothetical protein